MFAADIRRKRIDRMRAFLNWRWHLGEVLVKTNGETHYLWRAVDREGEVLETYDTKRRDRKTALKFLRKLLKRYGSPTVILTNRLRKNGAAMKVFGNVDKQEVGRWKNNRAEFSHLPFRRRERAMLLFQRMRSLQKLTAVHSSVYNHFKQERHFYSRQNFKFNRTAARSEWRQLRSVKLPVNLGKLRLVRISLTALPCQHSPESASKSQMRFRGNSDL